MIIRTIDEAKQSDRRVTAENWESIRLLLSEDKVGFSFHITTMYPNTETRIWYKNHFEAVFCIEGDGEIETLADGKIYPIRPGTIYILDEHDRHLLRANTQMRNVCVFVPALHGNETHDADGSYPLEPAPARR
ncbi:ectoine synthase [Sinorhizobium mexicanum]|uniref:L-ectoine synthase n=1 Tax=Sinorhizobium mexicanum TaxID=375549 RepID=A0A859QEM1_9HYPH|nr:ectoine synthase [Sinorhizobium mexicanum]MBP1888336.1 L-ectoine synthase [Sinorhizobium mexicanum]QLL64413.1 ectoine synthase [Sinorhizobium mexicanum]